MRLSLHVNQKTLLSLNLLSPVWGSLLLSLAIHSCKTPTDEQGFAPAVYAGDSVKVGVSRDSGKETIQCSDPKFDEMLCVFNRDMENLIKRCLTKQENEKAWYYFGTKKATGIKVAKPEAAEPSEDKADEPTTNEVPQGN